MSDLRAPSRRSFTLALAGAFAGLGLPGRARAASQRVLIIGGSAMRGALGKHLELGVAASGHEVDRQAKSASGLARPDFYDWLSEGPRFAQAFSPTATILLFGGNDGQSLRMAEGSDPEWIRWEEDAWATEYRRRVDVLAKAVAPQGEQVIWLGMPDMRSSKLDKRMQRINTILEEAMDALPGGAFVPTRGLLGPRYADSIQRGGKTVTIRAKDGVHFSTEGAKILAEALVPKIDGLL
ncbi:DUF459 domain-containing protein [Pseudenhygromyxa sp. WMMC2535]|uniref:DUF459 domain-containing protein n=1 Tax=Pseudenhygromyxa sp. WMMC2535 TaxID=2712867 RepID=UPI0015580D0A|nr:DUF459 domain-containing protein [Pseudenhygromyxa sp. WMMC2535]NVB42987.1 DUF459 domain-containing protein [Pseudenhygromyxa sp. WMMC2535]